jgi:tetratricopeptide (TPR) repeat protein
MARFSDETFDSAAEDYAKVASLAPTWHWSRLNYALCLQKFGRVDNAIAELDVAIAKNYRTVSVYRLRGDLCMSKGDAIAAKRDYDNAMQVEPKTDQDWVDRGLIQLSMDPASASKDFEQALKMNPNSIDAHQKLAFVYAELLGNAQQGLQHCDRLVELAPWQPTHRAGRSVLHARAGRLDQALEDLEVLKATPLHEGLVNYQVACSYSLLASMAQSNGQDFYPFSESAFDFLTLSLRLDPTILEISKIDPDVSWIREQPEYQAAVRAVATLYSKQKL